MEENNSGELTFKMIWQKIKVSGVRILVYSLIAVIIVGGILGICDIFVSKSQYETSITYYYSGVELGNDPWGGQEDVIADIRSVGNVSAALKNLEYSDAEVDALLSPIIRNLNVIKSVGNEVKDEDDVLVSANYKYRIVLSQDSQIDSHLKSRNDYNNILSSITTTYIDTFKSKYSFATSLTKMEGVDNYNYFQRYSAIRDNIKMLSEEATTWAKKAPDFVSTSQKISFASLNARIESASLKLDSYLSHILFNGMDDMREGEYIESKIKEASDLMATYNDEITAYNEVLSTIMSNPNAGVSGSGTIIVTPPDVEEITEAIAIAVEKKSNAQSEKNVWSNYKEYFDSTDYKSKSDEQRQALRNVALDLGSKALAEYNAVIDVYKAMIEEYNSGYNVAQLVRSVSTPKQSNTSVLTLKIGAIIEIAAILVAVVVAMFVTSKKGSMKLRKNKQFAEQSSMMLIGGAQNQAEPNKEDIPQIKEISDGAVLQEPNEENAEE